MQTDVHQHLWPEPFLDSLRRRSRPPRLDAWTLYIEGERPFAIDPSDHDVDARAAQAAEDRHDLVLVSPSAVLGIDRLDPDDAAELNAAWLEGAFGLGAPFRPWAGAGVIEPDPDALAEALRAGAVGLEVAADVLVGSAGLDAPVRPAAEATADKAALSFGFDRLAPLLAVLEDQDRPLLVHPGPPGDGDSGASGRPSWWGPVVTYTAQLQAAWWAWATAGRAAFPRLRVCFVALAGLAPLHAERHRARGGTPGTVDPLAFVETSSYSTKAIDATVRALGVDVVCHGSDRPYSKPPSPQLGAAAQQAFRITNPGRLLAPLIQEVTA